MNTFEIIISAIIALLIGGGCLFAYKRNRTNKVTQRDITIDGDGKVVGGDDNSINIDGNTNTTNLSK